MFSLPLDFFFFLSLKIKHGGGNPARGRRQKKSVQYEYVTPVPNYHEVGAHRAILWELQEMAGIQLTGWVWAVPVEEVLCFCGSKCTMWR